MTLETKATIDENRGVKVWVFANGDVFNQGKRIVVSSRVFKNYEQFLLQVSKDLNLLHGAVRKIYTVQGELITGLTQLRNGHSYVAVASSEVFKNVQYQVPERPGQSMLVAKTGDGGGAGLIKLMEKKKTVKDLTKIEQEDDKPLFTSTSKGYRVIVYLNGNDKIADLKIVLNYRNCKSFERLLATLSQIFNRRIRRIYDAQAYTRVRCLQDLRNGQNLVVGSEHEPLLKLKYPVIDPLMPPIKNAAHHIQKVVTFYPNGDAYHHGYQLTVKQARYPTLQHLLDHLNHAIHLVTGRATRIYRLDTGAQVSESDMTPIFSTQENAPNKFVLVSGDDVFYNIKYDMNAYQKLVFSASGDADAVALVGDRAVSRRVAVKTSHTARRRKPQTTQRGSGGGTRAKKPQLGSQTLTGTGAGLGGAGAAGTRAKSAAPQKSRAQTAKSAPRTPRSVKSAGASSHGSSFRAASHAHVSSDAPPADEIVEDDVPAGGDEDIQHGNNIKEFQTGAFRGEPRAAAAEREKKNTVQFPDGDVINVEDLPALPLSPPNARSAVGTPPRGLVSRPKTVDNLPPLPMTPANESNAYE
ncbi:hypothetical protein HDU84_002402 [Entophlyctis sp. JEL0112]|nr:hypothetical protein HDU84_002402 [Entophlyctis sp. JEL0112]